MGTCKRTLIGLLALAAMLGAQTYDGDMRSEGFYDSGPDKAKLEKAWQCGLYEAMRAMAPILGAETNKVALDGFKRNGCEAMSEYIHSTQPVRTGPMLPQTCVVGEQYFVWVTGDIYVCADAKNHWKPAPKGGAKK